MSDKPLQHGCISLGEIATKLPVLRIKCDRCELAILRSTAWLVAEYGADASIRLFQDDITRDCPRKADPKFEPGNACVPLCPDLPRIDEL